jgi:hypothetical protein
MKRSLLLLTLALAFLLPAAVALAASLPQPPNPTIAVPTSLAGVKIGQPEGKAKAAWGAGRGKCEKSSGGFGFCEYGESGGSRGYARIEFRGSKVGGASIGAGIDDESGQTVTAAAALMTFKTAGGIGLGSTYGKLKAAYPKGELIGKPSEGSFNYVFETANGHFMSFALLGESKRIYQIGLSDGREG